MERIEISVPGDMDPHTHALLERSLSPLEREIAESLYSVAGDAITQNARSDAYWTSNIKQRLEQLAHARGLLCCHSGNEMGEWLFDVSWYELRDAAHSPAWKNAEKLVLACECEWRETEDEILHDFYKLAWSNAPLRLFIYTHHKSKKQRLHPADLCRQMCPRSSSADYLLIGFPKNAAADDTFCVEKWTPA